MKPPMRKGQAVHRAVWIGAGVTLGAADPRAPPARSPPRPWSRAPRWPAWPPSCRATRPSAARSRAARPTGPAPPSPSTTAPGPRRRRCSTPWRARACAPPSSCSAARSSAIPDVVRRMVAEGHQVANHGYDHGILIFRGARHVRDQLAAHRARGRAGGRARRRCRGSSAPPTASAARPPRSARAAPATGWPPGRRASSTRPSRAPPSIARRASQALAPGTILLLHDADGWAPGRPRQQTADALPEICRSARARDLELVTLDELVGAA